MQVSPVAFLFLPVAGSTARISLSLSVIEHELPLSRYRRRDKSLVGRKQPAQTRLRRVIRFAVWLLLGSDPLAVALHIEGFHLDCRVSPSSVSFGGLFYFLLNTDEGVGWVAGWAGGGFQLPYALWCLLFVLIRQGLRGGVRGNFIQPQTHSLKQENPCQVHNHTSLFFPPADRLSSSSSCAILNTYSHMTSHGA